MCPLLGACTGGVVEVRQSYTNSWGHTHGNLRHCLCMCVLHIRLLS